MGFWEGLVGIFGAGTREGVRRKTGPLLILLVLGIGLLLFNSFFSYGKRKARPAPAVNPEVKAAPWGEQELSRSLAEILSKIHGVSGVELFLTPETSGRLELVADREQTQRRTNEGDGGGGNREVTEETLQTTYVILRDSTGNELPLVVEEGKPRYRGVLVVAAGVEDPAVKARVIEALQVLLGLPAHRITVLPR